MLIVPTSRIILLKNPIEIDYENELTFASRQAQYDYFYNLPKLECENATYQRKDEVVRFPTNDNTNIYMKLISCTAISLYIFYHLLKYSKLFS